MRAGNEDDRNATLCSVGGGCPQMPTNMHAAEFYRREAERLSSMAEAEMFSDVRDELIEMARRYRRLADQRERLAGRRYAPCGVGQKAANEPPRL